jgi:hypothetical protein
MREILAMGGSAKDMELFKDIDSGSELEGDDSDNSDNEDDKAEKVKAAKAAKAAAVKKEKKNKAVKSNPAEEEEVTTFFFPSYVSSLRISNGTLRKYAHIIINTRYIFFVWGGEHQLISARTEERSCKFHEIPLRLRTDGLFQDEHCR